jgi:signal transduction histidine kinase
MDRHGVHFDMAQLQVINTSIEGAIRQSVTAYVVAVAALREQIISSLMHDFRTPLGVVSMAAEVIGRTTSSMDVKLVVAKSLLLRRSVGLVGSGSLVFLD